MFPTAYEFEMLFRGLRFHVCWLNWSAFVSIVIHGTAKWAGASSLGNSEEFMPGGNIRDILVISGKVVVVPSNFTWYGNFVGASAGGAAYSKSAINWFSVEVDAIGCNDFEATAIVGVCLGNGIGFA